ncbi:DMT family transporter [Pseudohalocynthiibacter aestuariivivens]|uniref:DMT family transporter n=1 Tax=Pseudohalocynthiibacter aestuariivivens TaxID=1591409 RepID=A0ABV5JC34_9RHOB|nr:DMT family transporter [Pseudohalocynthiibacter aestuariivivens]MBS9718405.1 DMT family transporter [Pseudohalocynthiibacter aestuariivivens]
MTPDRPFLGLLLMIGFCVLAPLGDGMAKMLGDTIPLGQLLIVRFAAQAIILAPIVIATRRHWKMSRRVTTLAFIRSLLHIVGIGAMFTSLRFLPLADAVAIAFVMPFIMLLLGRFVLDEEVGYRRIIACCVGFAGTLLVIQPSFSAVGLPALLPLLVAVVFALFMLVTRQIAKEVDPISLQAVNGIMACVALTPILLFGAANEIAAFGFVWPSTLNWLLLVGIGVLGTSAHLLMTWSLRFAPSATLAPVQYLEIPFATVIGWMFFRDLPNGLAAIGILITVGAGIYILLREQAMARLATETP